MELSDADAIAIIRDALLADDFRGYRFDEASATLAASRIVKRLKQRRVDLIKHESPLHGTPKFDHPTD